VEPRLRALGDLSVPDVREGSGRDEYDGVVQDLSPSGVTRGLAELGGPAVDDAYDELLLTAFEAAARVAYGEVQVHRRDPLLHVSALELACYDRDYAPVADRERARAQHLAAWPDAVDAALASLDQVPADVAAGTLSSVRGLAAGVDDEARWPPPPSGDHVERAAREGDPDPSLGGRRAGVDCAHVVAGGAGGRPRPAGRAGRRRARPPAGAARRRLRTHRARCARRGGPVAARARPPRRRRVLDAARALTAEVIAWTAGRGLVPTTTASAASGRRRSRGRTPWR
jgi:hypothetical protein